MYASRGSSTRKTRGIAYKNYLIGGYRAQHGPQPATASEGGGFLVTEQLQGTLGVEEGKAEGRGLVMFNAGHRCAFVNPTLVSRGGKAVLRCLARGAVAVTHATQGRPLIVTPSWG